MTRLKQTITRWQGMGLIATTLLGTGVFILPQLTLAAAGDKAILAWGLLLLAILPLTQVFAQLGRHFPHAAGPAYFVERAFSAKAGRVVGLMFLFVVPLGAPAALMITFEFLTPIATLNEGEELFGQLLLLGIIFIINRQGIQLSGTLQLGLTIAITGVVILLFVAVVASPPAIHPEHTAIPGTWSGVMVAVSIAIWSFLGIETATHLSEEFRDVQRDFMPAMLIGVVLVGLIYIGCTHLSSFGLGQPLAIVGTFEQLFGGVGRWVIALLGFISGIATVNVYFASVARLAWSFSCEGVLPQRLAKLNKHQTPEMALMSFLLISAGVLLLSHLLALPYTAMMQWVNGVFVLVYIASMLAAWRLLPQANRLWITLGLLACLLFIISLGAAMIYAALLLATTGLWVSSQPNKATQTS